MLQHLPAQSGQEAIGVAEAGDLQVVILCGGKGSRIYPFSEYFPKPMMPVNGRPILVHLMNIYARQGFRRFVLASGHRREMLLDYFDGRFPDWEVHIPDTGADTDTADRIRRCSEYFGKTFFATYGDGLGDVDLNALLAFHRRRRAEATVTAVPLRSQYGTLQFDPEGRVQRFTEKPVIQNQWINAGFFVFEKAGMAKWQGTNLESDVLPGLVTHGQLYTWRHRGFWKSMDTSKDQQEMERLSENGSAPWDGPKSADVSLLTTPISIFKEAKGKL